MACTATSVDNHPITKVEATPSYPYAGYNMTVLYVGYSSEKHVKEQDRWGNVNGMYGVN